jgi:DNA ligase (NAD+)
MVEANGGKNSSSVTRELTYLVCSEDKGSSKSEKAKKYQVKILSEEDFMNLVGSEGLHRNRHKP